jgi:formylglycine-generating enzyme required for sulfatase activity
MIEIENVITGEKQSIIIAANDFPNKMNWADAKKACSSLGKGWRLPTIQELEIICKTMHKKGLGNFKKESYWSSEENNIVKDSLKKLNNKKDIYGE